MLAGLLMFRFYGPVNPMGSCRARSVYLIKHLLDRLSPLTVNQYCAHSFTRNRQLPVLNQRKGESDRRKYFMINLHERMLLNCCGMNPQPSDHQSDEHPTEPLRPANFLSARVVPLCSKIFQELYIIQLKISYKF